MQFNREKFKALVHYVIWKGGDIDGFGAVKLNKVLWFSDARMYMLRGEPITGASYTRQEHGPVPRAIMHVRDELQREGKVRIWEDRFYNHKIIRFKALRNPDASFLSAEEKQTVDWWIDHIAKEHTAATISEASHDYGWEIIALGEELPYRAFLASRVREELRPEDREWVEKRAKELGLP